jgi:hypothetical protein
MTLDELIDQVSTAITASCSLPYSPPKAEIERIIQLEMRTLYRDYRTLWQDRIYLLNKRYYQSPEWKSTRTFQLPECVVGIKKVVENTGGNRVFGINDPDLNFDRLMASDLYLTPMSSDQITYRTIQWSFWDMARTFNLKDINHSFNMNTHRLVITGRTPVESLMILSLIKIPDEDAYEDPIVLRWMIAQGKRSLARILGAFNYQLLGNITINYQMYKEEGDAELQELKDTIKGQDTVDWFVIFN